MGRRGGRLPARGGPFRRPEGRMHVAQLTVTIVGFALIGWVLWYFLVPPARGTRARRGEGS